MDEYLFIEVAKLKADRAKLEQERLAARPQVQAEQARQPRRRTFSPAWAEWLARQSNWNWREQS
jgi:outer membrane murein-binding lipoprotein Lpp